MFHSSKFLFCFWSSTCHLWLIRAFPLKVIVVYNSLGWKREDIIRIPVSSSFLVIVVLSCLLNPFALTKSILYWQLYFSLHDEWEWLLEVLVVLSFYNYCLWSLKVSFVKNLKFSTQDRITLEVCNSNISFWDWYRKVNSW